MPECVVCGNDYDKAFAVRTADGTTRVFDSVECVAHEIAPRCGHCGCRILGHGVEVNDAVYCCRHCAEAEHGSTSLTDRA